MKRVGKPRITVDHADSNYVKIQFDVDKDLTTGWLESIDEAIRTVRDSEGRGMLEKGAWTPVGTRAFEVRALNRQLEIGNKLVNVNVLLQRAETYYERTGRQTDERERLEAEEKARRQGRHVEQVSAATAAQAQMEATYREMEEKYAQ